MTNETLEKPERRAPADKFNDRRSELVDAALETLAEFGYARTTLRDIAQNSRFSHGVIHYYFSDKVDLIAYCVRDYKAKCVARYDQIMVDAESYAALVERLAAGLCETIVADGKMHRLWYDLRSQALYEQRFHGDVDEIDKSLENMIARIVARAVELRSATQLVPDPIAYAAIDGLFQSALHKHLKGDKEALVELRQRVREFLNLATSGIPSST